MKPKKQLTETRIWTEPDGTVRTREVILESRDGKPDMTPHPTETRVVIANNDAKIIFPKKYKEIVPINEGFEAIRAAIIKRDRLWYGER